MNKHNFYGLGFTFLVSIFFIIYICLSEEDLKNSNKLCIDLKNENTELKEMISKSLKFSDSIWQVNSGLKTQLELVKLQLYLKETCKKPGYEYKW